MGHPNLTRLDRFVRKVQVDRDSDCWLWTGHIAPNGYATFRSEITNYAHRFSYSTLVGPIPEGLEIDHKCHMRHCVNPAHLEAVTRRENKDRGFYGHGGGKCHRGHKMTPENSYVHTWNGWTRVCCRTCKLNAQRRRNARVREARCQSAAS